MERRTAVKGILASQVRHSFGAGGTDMPAKRRTTVPDDIAAEVLFLSDRTCCVCTTSGSPVQLHHLDGDPSHHDAGNIAVLCLGCHRLTQIRGGFDRKLDAQQIRLYREEWHAVVAARRDRNRHVRPASGADIPVAIYDLPHAIVASTLMDAGSDSTMPARERLLAEMRLNQSERIKAIDDLLVTVDDQDEAVRYFRLMSQAARYSIRVVDFISLSQWRWNRRLHNYLDEQLRRCARNETTLALQRIRFVSRRDLSRPYRRALLRQFIARHSSGTGNRVELLLCPSVESEGGERFFYPRTGCVLVDKDDDVACLTASVDEQGFIDHASLYLMNADPVRRLETTFRRLADRITKEGLHDTIIDELSAHEEDDAASVFLPPWSGAASTTGQFPIADSLADRESPQFRLVYESLGRTVALLASAPGTMTERLAYAYRTEWVPLVDRSEPLPPALDHWLRFLGERIPKSENIAEPPPGLSVADATHICNEMVRLYRETSPIYAQVPE